MAQLTLTERSGLANNGRFQSRLHSALKKKAAYWLDAAQYPAAVADFNQELQKRRRFAKTVLGSYYQQIQPFCEYFTNQYNVDVDSENVGTSGGAGNRIEDGVAGTFDADSNQLADFELTDSTAIDLAFDFFAGVEAGDDTEAITW